MKQLLFKLATEAMLTVAMLVVLFSPYQALLAQAQTSNVFTTGAAPITGTNAPVGGTAPTSLGDLNANGTTAVAPGSVNPADTSNSFDNTVNFPSGVTQDTSSLSAANGNITTPASTPQTTSPTAAPNQPSPSDPFSACGVTNISGCILAAVYVFTIGIGSLFAYAAAYFFDLATELSLNSAAYALSFISTGWTTARDLANMAFLFILLFIAFTIIFKAETSGTMSLLAAVILVALLVNFSFFFTRVVIDAGNILAIEFYNSIPAQTVGQTISNGAPVTSTVASAVSTVAGAAGGNNTNEKDLTSSIMNMLQLQNLLNNNSFAAVSTAGSSGSTGAQTTGRIIATIFLYIMAAFMFWLLTVAFITNGIKFLFRIVVLWFLIIASPLAFIAAAAQGFNSKYFKQWKDMLIAHAFYPVAFLFIFLMLTNFANNVNNTGLVGSVFMNLNSASGNTWPAIIGAIVAIAIRLSFIIAVLFVGIRASDSISVAGAAFADKVGGWVGGKFIGAYGAAGRNTIGLGAQRLSQSQGFQNLAARNSVARGLWRGTNRIAGASFDVRAPLKAAGVKDVTGLNLKGANKGGFKKKEEDRIKATEAEAKKFIPTEVQKEANKKAREEADREYDSNQKIAKQAAEKEITAPDSVITKQIVETTKERDAAEKTKNDTQEQLNEANKGVEAASKEHEAARQEVVNRRDEGKANTPEMETAIKNRDTAKAKLDKLSEAKNTIAGDLAKHTTNIQSFNANIQKLMDEQKKKIEERTKELTPPKRIIKPLADNKKLYADSIAGNGPSGRFGNLSRLGWIPLADKEAALKINKVKSKEQKALDALKEFGDEQKAGTEKKEDKEEEKK